MCIPLKVLLADPDDCLVEAYCDHYFHDGFQDSSENSEMASVDHLRKIDPDACELPAEL